MAARAFAALLDIDGLNEGMNALNGFEVRHARFDRDKHKVGIGGGQHGEIIGLAGPPFWPITAMM